MNKYRKILSAVFSACLMYALPLHAQKKKKNIPAQTAVTAPTPIVPAPKSGIRPYAEVVPAGAKTTNGFLTVHIVGDRYLFEIPDSVLKRDLYSANRIVNSSQDYRSPFGGLCSYGSDFIGSCMFRLEKIGGNKIAIRIMSTTERTSDDGENGISGALQNSNFQPINAFFPIKAIGKDSSSSIIDLTDFLNTENAVFGYMPDLKALGLPIGAVAPDRSYISGVQAYPTNVEISTTKTFTAGVFTTSATYNNSIILLSKDPMHARLGDPRVGFLSVLPTEYQNFGANGRITTQGDIWRWRLEPRPEEMDKYLKGELVEPKKPIIFYIDPLTPKKWIPYLIAGVNDWQAAFEKAGFKNAIIAKEVAPGDTTFNINDARHNVIVYKASAIGNAMGHSFQDPRSGEIIESHIQWYHSLMEVLYKWYFIQAGAVDIEAQKPQFSDELMGQLIRFVSSHEVGHAIGLRHNWGASSSVPTTSLRDKAWVEEHGHTPSIMDYARFNYVAQPEDHIGKKGIFPRIGDYDKWAVEWGYRILPEKMDPAEEKKLLNQMIVDKLKISSRYKFGIGDDPSAKYPSNMREDLGDDAVLSSGYGIKNLKRIKPNLIKWVQEPGSSYEKLDVMYKAVVEQFDWYIKHVTANIGGIYYTPKVAEEAGTMYAFQPKDRQRRAVAFLNTELFATPEWLIDKQLYLLTTSDFSLVEKIQKRVIQQLTDVSFFAKLRASEILNPTTAYTAKELLKDLNGGIFGELKSGIAITKNRRFLQKTYVNSLIALIGSLDKSDSDAGSTVKTEAKRVWSQCRSSIPKTRNQRDKAHLIDLADRIYAAVYRPMKIQL